jgi:hypothetical protein
MTFRLSFTKFEASKNPKIKGFPEKISDQTKTLSKTFPFQRNPQIKITISHKTLPNNQIKIQMKIAYKLNNLKCKINNFFPNLLFII